MSRLEITSPNQAQLMIEELYKDLERRIESSPPGLCPVDMTRAFVEMCHTHTCGKCVPCRVGLWQLKNLLTDVMNGEATMDTLKLMEELSKSIMNGADCAIGYEAAFAVYRSLKEAARTMRSTFIRAAAPATTASRFRVSPCVRLMWTFRVTLPWFGKAAMQMPSA